jgi:hypothetical protein
MNQAIVALGKAKTVEDVSRIASQMREEADMTDALELVKEHYPDAAVAAATATNLEQLAMAVLVHQYPLQENLYQQLRASVGPLQHILNAAASNKGLSHEDCNAALARLVENDLVIQKDEEEQAQIKKRPLEEEEEDTDKRAKDDFDTESFLTEIKSMIPLVKAKARASSCGDSSSADTLLATFVRAHLPGQGLSKLVRSFRDPLAEGAYIKLALTLGCDWQEIGTTLGIKAQKPETSARVQLAQFLYDLIVTHHLHRLRYLQPTDRHLVPRFKGHIRPIKAYIADEMSAEEKAWWRNGDEQVPMLSTRNASGKEICYVDPMWLLQ